MQTEPNADKAELWPLIVVVAIVAMAAGIGFGLYHDSPQLIFGCSILLLLFLSWVAARHWGFIRHETIVVKAYLDLRDETTGLTYFHRAVLADIKDESKVPRKGVTLKPYNHRGDIVYFRIGTDGSGRMTSVDFSGLDIPSYGSKFTVIGVKFTEAPEKPKANFRN